MNAIQLTQPAATLDALALPLVTQPLPTPEPDGVVVRVRYAGINPSDVSAALGNFPRAAWPRHPGRDFAGEVVAGPAHLLGQVVWGTGGDVGISRDGSHATYLRLPLAAVSAKPAALSLPEAAGAGVPFVTAYEGLRRAGGPQPGQWVLIFGVNGKVGQAAAQLATRAGAQVIGVQPAPAIYAGFASGPVHLLDSSTQDVVAAVRELTGGHGADIAYNTVGGAVFAVAIQALAHRGTQIFIADRARQPVPFDIFFFYRQQLTFVGIDTQELDAPTCTALLTALAPGFEEGSLRAFPVLADSIYPLAQAAEAYRRTYQGSPEKLLLRLP